MPIEDEFNSVTIITICGIIVSCLTYSIHECFRSKCKKCTICGIINVERDVNAENVELELEMNKKEEEKNCNMV